ncbi:hypothetical protein JMF94_12995 [Desulfovibrio sp. UIB00]|uniref:hypothetical protein n=1 Tax=Desulfovibrio sp. UIB00 TaxID=2804314 RepID=UPI001F10BBD2|nr:hypothetical protein [Desulfovibrio sp. UIB00]MCH5146000.1 hypothetical protein [Desulfovibrio sp. UIB00]
MDKKSQKDPRGSIISEKILEATSEKIFREQIGIFNNPGLGQIRLFNSNPKGWLTDFAKSITEPYGTIMRQWQETSAQIDRITSSWSKLNPILWGNSLPSAMGAMVSPRKGLNIQSNFFTSPVLPPSITSFAGQWQKLFRVPNAPGLQEILNKYETPSIKDHLSTTSISEQLKSEVKELKKILHEDFDRAKTVSTDELSALIKDIETLPDDLSLISKNQFEAACITANVYLNSNTDSFDIQHLIAALQPHARFLLNAIIKYIIIPVIIFYVVEYYKDIAAKISSVNACSYASLQQRQGFNVPMAEISNPNGARVYPDSTDDIAPVYKFEHKQFVVLMWDRTKDGKWRRVAYAFDKDTNAPIKFGWIRTNTFERIRVPIKNIIGLYSEEYDK